MLLYYIRHGDPIYNPDSLTPLGEKQAEALSLRLKDAGLQKIFASTSNRAVQTATPTAEKTGLEIVKLPFANEHLASTSDFMQNMEDGVRRWLFATEKYKKVFASDEMFNLGYRWTEHPLVKDTKMPEAWANYRREIDAWLLTLGIAYVPEAHAYRQVGEMPERIALFAHQGFGKIFMATLLDLPYPQYCTRFEFSHSSMSVVELKPEKDGMIYPCALQIANDSHLYADGELDTTYNHSVRI